SALKKEASVPVCGKADLEADGILLIVNVTLAFMKMTLNQTVCRLWRIGIGIAFRIMDCLGNYQARKVHRLGGDVCASQLRRGRRSIITATTAAAASIWKSYSCRTGS